jgi:type II secretory pathway pseudopilin PulG
MRFAKQGSQRGFTLVEVTIILLVLMILSAILLPNLGGFSRMARYARVKEDVGALCASLAAMLHDTGESAFWEYGGRGSGGSGSDTPTRDTVGLLVGDGDTPTLNYSNRGDDGFHWQLPVGDFFSEPHAISGQEELFIVDTFANHLVQNQPLGDPGNAYRTPADMISGATSGSVPGGLHFDSAAGQGFNSQFAWRGPYMADPIEPDPWGNRYAANVFGRFIPAGQTSDGFSSAVVCYSAGPDEEIDTVFNQPNGWSVGDDDVIAVLSGGGER